MTKFEEGFYLGASTSAHQTEGDNTKCDYYLMENMEHSEFSEKSGKAVDHYNRYKEDILLLKEAWMQNLFPEIFLKFARQRKRNFYFLLCS